MRYEIEIIDKEKYQEWGIIQIPNENNYYFHFPSGKVILTPDNQFLFSSDNLPITRIKEIKTLREKEARKGEFSLCFNKLATEQKIDNSCSLNKAFGKSDTFQLKLVNNIYLLSQAEKEFKINLNCTGEIIEINSKYSLVKTDQFCKPRAKFSRYKQQRKQYHYAKTP